MTKSSGNGSCKVAIHLALQGKGGVGKSLISAILSQYLSSKGQDVCGIDVDPVNQTFSEYQGLRVECLNLLREGSIDQREFDLLMERFLKEVGTFVVDTGASTFIPLWHYILENQALDHLRQKGKRVFIQLRNHRRSSLNDTLSGFEALAETTREKNIVVWLNEYFGPVLQDGAAFADMPVCKKHANKLHGSVAIARRTADTFGRDMEEMISRKLTFDEAVMAADFTIMTKQRLLVVQRDLFEQLDRIGLV